MEIRAVNFGDDKLCPFAGSGMVVVLETSPHQARLFHAPTLREWVVPINNNYDQRGNVTRYGLRQASGPKDLLWPVNQSQSKCDVVKLVELIRQRCQWSWLYAKDFNLQTVIAVLMALTSLSEVEVRNDLQSLRLSTTPVKTRPPGRSGARPVALGGSSVADETKKSSGHRTGVKYLNTDKCDATKFRGQKQLVAQAIGAFSTFKTLEEIVEKVEKNGGYTVAAAGGVTDSVHYHLRQMVKDGLIQEEVPAEETKEVAEGTAKGTNAPAPPKAKKSKAKKTEEAPKEEAVNA